MTTRRDIPLPVADANASPSITRRDLISTAARVGTGIALGTAAFQSLPLAAARASQEQAPVELTYWNHIYKPANDLTTKLIAAYMRSNPQVKISYDTIAYGSFETKLLTAFAGGTGPDVYWAGDWLMPSFIPKGVVAPLDTKAYGVPSQAAFLNRYDPHTFDAFTANGTVYAGGISEVDTFSLFYNKAVFRAEGIPYPSATQPMTWAEFSALAGKLTKFAGGKRVRSGTEFVYGVPIFAAMYIEPIVRQMGTDLLDPITGAPLFDSPAAIATMQYFSDLRMKYKANDPSFSVDNASDFDHGRLAMYFANLSSIPGFVDTDPKIKGDIGIAPWPVWKRGGIRSTGKYAWAWLVNPRSAPEKQSAAWRFISFLQSQAHQWFDQCGYVEPLKNNLSYELSKQPLANVYHDDLNYARYFLRSPHFEELTQILSNAFTSVQSGANAASAMKKAQSEALDAVR